MRIGGLLLKAHTPIIVGAWSYEAKCCGRSAHRVAGLSLKYASESTYGVWDWEGRYQNLADVLLMRHVESRPARRIWGVAEE